MLWRSSWRSAAHGLERSAALTCLDQRLGASRQRHRHLDDMHLSDLPLQSLSTADTTAAVVSLLCSGKATASRKRHEHVARAGLQAVVESMPVSPPSCRDMIVPCNPGRAKFPGLPVGGDSRPSPSACSIRVQRRGRTEPEHHSYHAIKNTDWRGNRSLGTPLHTSLPSIVVVSGTVGCQRSRCAVGGCNFGRSSNAICRCSTATSAREGGKERKTSRAYARPRALLRRWAVYCKSLLRTAWLCCAWGSTR